MAQKVRMVFLVGVLLVGIGVGNGTKHGVAATQAAVHCPALPPPGGVVIAVNTEAGIRNAAYNASPGTTVLIAAGTYHLSSFIHIVNNGIALRGVTGNRADVILDFGGMVGGQFGILVEADDVTIADLTIRNAADHGVSIQGYDRPVLYNLHILDINDQLVKVNPRIGGGGSDDGLLACSRLEYTTSAPDNYTNGISAHHATDWVVRDNQWYRIRYGDSPTGPTILFWRDSAGTVVERNLLVDCYRGITFGLDNDPGLEHVGGVVRNNIIYASARHDTVIEMASARGWLVAHNTVLLLNPVSGLTWGMEARFASSQGTFAYNLTNMNIWEDRDGASGALIGNLTNAQTNWFVDPNNADLHLLPTVLSAIDQAGLLAGVTDDYDGDTRPYGLFADIGADEVNTGSPGERYDISLPFIRR